MRKKLYIYFYDNGSKMCTTASTPITTSIGFWNLFYSYVSSEISYCYKFATASTPITTRCVFSIFASRVVSSQR
jgi:hypothetical protein